MSATLEEYLKTIYTLIAKTSSARVTDIAKELSCSKPSVNRAIKNLRDLDLVEYEVYGDINLTYQGEEKAKEIIKKHDIIKMFLVDILDIDEKDAEEEAKSMKHAMSPDTTKKLEKYISKIMDLGDLDCDYDENNPKCQSCIKVTIKNRLNKKIK